MSYSAKTKMSFASGVRTFLINRDIYHQSDKKMNDVLIAFLKDAGLKYHKHSYKYKGIYNAFCLNSITVQENWDKFHPWVHKNKDLCILILNTQKKKELLQE